MHSTTFLGGVKDGRIVTGQPLTDFEGKQVYVTLIAPEVQPRAATPEAGRTEALVMPLCSEEADILEDAGRIRVPARAVTDILINVVDVERVPMRVYASDLED